MAELQRVDRRLFIAELGHKTFAVALLGVGVVACSSSTDGETVSQTTIRASTSSAGTVTSAVTTQPLADGTDQTTGPGEELRWELVTFPSVAAYVLARGAELAIVDTGHSGETARFDDALGVLGAGWDDVDHVVVTHLHRDHAGGLSGVLEAAPAAIGYAGELDISGIDSPRALTSVGDGDEIFGLEIIASPGHTPGHISVYDPASGLLVAGDALTSEGADILGPNPQYTADLDTAHESVLRLAALDVDTIVVGHGPPIETRAGEKLVDLAASL